MGCAMGRPRKPKLSSDEIAKAFAEPTTAKQFPPVLNVSLAAELLRVSPKTVYAWHGAGRLSAAAVKRGKHLMFWRDRLIDVMFNGPNWVGETNDNTN
jgi:hypothetical protein